MSENTAGGTVETPKEVDWEARAIKAEAKIVDMKTNPTKETPKEEVKKDTEEAKISTTSNFITKEDFEAERFFDNNKELVEHKDFILEKVSNGNSFDEAKHLLKLKDPTIENRQKTKQSNFTAGEVPIDKQSFTMEQLGDMSQDDYNRAMDLVDSGKAKVTE